VQDPRPLYSPRYVGGVIALLTGAVFVEFFHRQVLAVAMNAIKRELALGDAQLGSLVTAFALAYFAGAIVLGRVADRLPRRNIYALGIAFWSAATAAAAACSSFGALAATRFAVGVGQSSAGATNSPLLADYVAPERRGSALAIITMGATLGALAAGVLGASGVVEAFGWRGMFVGAGVFGVVFSALFAVLVKEPPRGWSEGRAREPMGLVPLGEVARSVARAPALLHTFLGATVNSVAIFSSAQWVVAFFERAHAMTTASASLVLIGSALAGTLGAIVGGIVANRAWTTRPRGVLLIPALCCLGAFPVMALASSVASTPVAIALYALGSVLAFVHSAPAGAAMQGLIPDRMRGFLSGLTAALLTLIGLGGGPLLTGFLSDLLGASRDPASIGRALAWVSVLYAWAAVHFWLASRTLQAELAVQSRAE
jgi:predicted MFS family arabinose efflux permease